jgi:hypothetical protein
MTMFQRQNTSFFSPFLFNSYSIVTVDSSSRRGKDRLMAAELTGMLSLISSNSTITPKQE